VDCYELRAEIALGFHLLGHSLSIGSDFLKSYAENDSGAASGFGENESCG
jgi:hypothetical protein